MAEPMMYKDFGEEMVTVTVGQDSKSQTFRLHQNLISRSSSFFKSVFESHFIEARQQHLKLPEDHRSVFMAFCDWLYSRQIREPALYTERNIPDDLFWLRLYHFADRYDNSPLQSIALLKIKAFESPESIPSKQYT